jgi:ElaB/YqjD/DUF883 family membrane-anchored ribosome-binding protein
MEMSDDCTRLYIIERGFELLVLSTRSEGAKAQDWEVAIEELRKDLEGKLDEIQKRLEQPIDRERRAVVDDETVANLRDKLEVARARVMDSLETGEDIVRQHPIIVLGAALTVGLMMGALLSHRGND